MAAGGAPSSRAGKGYFLTEEQIQHLLDASVRSAIQAHISLSPGPSPTSSSRIHKKDLPELKGYSPDGADAVSFLDTLDTLCTLHKIPETEQAKYASLSFPARGTLTFQTESKHPDIDSFLSSRVAVFASDRTGGMPLTPLQRCYFLVHGLLKPVLPSWPPVPRIPGPEVHFLFTSAVQELWSVGGACICIMQADWP